MSLYGLGCTCKKIADDSENIVVSSAVLTVAESKRLIAKAVARLPVVRHALNEGIVIICKGTTNTYVAQEILNKPIEHGSFVLGRVYPSQDGKKLGNVKQINEVILINGVHKPEISLQEAVEMLSPQDVVIKGANLLDYKNKLAGVCIGSPTAGTAGTVVPFAIARRAHMIIPIGLEKLVAGNLVDIAEMLNNPTARLGEVPSMYCISGHIITELEAFKLFADVKVYETACGGIGGQEGGRWFAIEGAKNQVQKALKTVDKILGEPPFVN